MLTIVTHAWVTSEFCLTEPGGGVRITTRCSAALIDWYGETARDLPWRRTGVTAWQVLMSEIMLQQTPVVAGAPVWEEWVRRWPVPSAMAASQPPADVLRAWGKLGYPRRALRLHECAGVLATEHTAT